VRPKPKEHGLGNQIEGFIEAGKKVIVVEDLISTGKSSLQVVEVLRNAGLQVEGMVAIFTYGFPEASKSFKEADVPLKTLTNYETLIDLAIQKGIVQKQQESILKEWADNPSVWKKNQ
jgi:orotate phosphoribosyltransferase